MKYIFYFLNRMLTVVFWPLQVIGLFVPVGEDDQEIQVADYLVVLKWKSQGDKTQISEGSKSHSFAGFEFPEWDETAGFKVEV